MKKIIFLEKFKKRYNFQNRLAREKKELIRKKIKEGHDFSEEEIERIKIINENLDLSKPIICHKIIDLVGILFGCLVLLLLQCEIETTDIELKLLVSKVGYRLSKKHNLIDDLNLKSIGILDYKSIDLPKSETKKARSIKSSNRTGLDFKVMPINNGRVQGSLTLNEISGSENTFFSIEGLNKRGSYSILLSSGKTEIKTSIKNYIEFRSANSFIDTVNFSTPQSLTFDFKSSIKSVDLEFLDDLPSFKSNNFEIDSLSLTGEENKKTVSKILSGSLVFKNFENKEKQIRMGEMLKFESITGKVEFLKLKDNQIELMFIGKAKGLKSGNQGNEKNIMPTAMEELIDFLGLGGFLATVTFFLTMGYKVLGLIKNSYWK